MKLASVCLATLAVAVSTFAQSNSGIIRGTVLDPSGAAIAGAKVEIHNPVSHYDQSTKTNPQGSFEFDNIPFNNYHMVASATGFQTASQDIDVRSPLPLEAKFNLAIGASTTSVTVEASGDLVESDPTTHTDVDRELFDKLPLESASSSLSSLVTIASPGVSADSDGLFHGLGDHASNSFSIDGQPITDQQSKVFSNQLPVDAVQSMEVIEGAPPAEYGGKTSLVIVVTTRSGLGVTTPHGDVTASYGTFGSSNEGVDLAYGQEKWGNFISVSGLNTGRFLDGPEYQVFHDHGNEENAFDRMDFRLSDQDSININLGFTRSWFQTPNSYDAQNATGWNGLTVDNGGLGPNGLPVGSADQRSQIRTFNIAPVWTRMLNPNTVLTLGALRAPGSIQLLSERRSIRRFHARSAIRHRGAESPADQCRRPRQRVLRQRRSQHEDRAQYEHTFITEKDSFGLVDPTGNAPCLNADGSPDTNPLLTNPANCTGGAAAESQLYSDSGLLRSDPNRAAACFGRLPEQHQRLLQVLRPFGHQGICASTSRTPSTCSNWTFNLGVRFDKYNGVTSAAQGEPRLGIAYNIKPTGTVIRASYARTMETPFNENLVLASQGCTNPVIAAFQTLVPGGACVTTTPLSPGHRNEFHAGLSQAFGKYLVIDGEYIWKYTHKAFDFSVLGNTPITYPIEWTSSKIPGYAIRAHNAELPWVDGFHGDVQRGGTLFRPADRRHRLHAGGDQRVPHRP